MIHTVVASLETLAHVLQRQSEPYVICHADLHPSNIIRGQLIRSLSLIGMM